MAEFVAGLAVGLVVGLVFFGVVIRAAVLVARNADE